MTDRFSEDDVIATITRLTRGQLASYIEAEFIRPVQGDGGFVFGRIDIARLELLCDLSQDLDLDDTALGVVISLIDQLHAARQDCVAMARAISRLPQELRESVIASISPP